MSIKVHNIVKYCLLHLVQSSFFNKYLKMFILLGKSIHWVKFHINLHQWIQSRIRFEAWRFHNSVQSKIEFFFFCFSNRWKKRRNFNFPTPFSTRQLCDFKLQCLFSVKAIIIFSSSWEIVLGNSTTKKNLLSCVHVIMNL